MLQYPIVVYDPPIWTVYMHVNKINGKKYIGITSKDPLKRWGKNGERYKPARKNTPFHNAIQHYGWENFSHYILIENLSKYQAGIMEIVLIKYYNTFVGSHNGYNATKGGFKMMQGMTRSDSHLKKKVVCLNTRQVYDTILDAGEMTNTKCLSGISKVCMGKCRSAGKTQDGQHLAWAYYDDFIKMSENEIQQRVLNANTRIDKKPVICINNLQIYNGLIEAEEQTGVSRGGIKACCTLFSNPKKATKRCYAGIDKESDEFLGWMFLPDYNKLSKDDKQWLSENYRYLFAPFNTQSVICLNTLETFPYRKYITKIIDNFPVHNINLSCVNQRRSCGKHPITQEPLYWMYLNDYKRLTDEEKHVLKDQFYTGSFLVSDNKEGLT